MLIVKNTNDLTPKELVKIFMLRTSVFVVEQNCPYQEVDTDDLNDIHVVLVDDKTNNINAYTRIIDHDKYVSFGRVIVAKNYRKQGLGNKIVAETLNVINKKYPKLPIKIQAQAHLQKFYGSFGFKSTSSTYLEDGIPHIDMEKIE
ncbi:acetyltransferase [Apilactobacillus ozensis DSM 23829 = JCM 17196]|uniref:Acetyltransferase n=1 Tax=Apilactobacillus ozensis DSM 23829 = JCM 17196 TaxID=1423781 RepID=A0A0R2AJX7_9LACO|nr:GNAT family N-acetyltransferase [Apilactobacillus ozensis]KRM67550.1 acetyltransferase [Apilactobacillus ozensis DSM 23829 = JCM 17196]